MNRESINIVAELLFRDAARATAANGVGSAESGLANLREFMQKKVAANPYEISRDGRQRDSPRSTASRRARWSSCSATRTTRAWASAFHAVVAGRRRVGARFAGACAATPAQGNLHAKTGTTNTVAASPAT